MLLGLNVIKRDIEEGHKIRKEFINHAFDDKMERLNGFGRMEQGRKGCGVNFP